MRNGRVSLITISAAIKNTINKTVVLVASFIATFFVLFTIEFVDTVSFLELEVDKRLLVVWDKRDQGEE